MDRIRGETRIENRDQILLTKKGFKLKAEDVLAVIENENIFQTTLHSDLSNRQKQTPVIVFFLNFFFLCSIFISSPSYCF